MKYNSFVVLGLGKFGQAIADKLLESGADVMVVDNDEDIIEQYSAKATAAIEADLTDPTAIKAMGISNIDCAIICMGMSLEASIICTMVAKECGVKWVVAKAGSDRMGQVLTKVGADEIIYPEEESGIRTAKRLIASNFLEYFDVSDELCLVEMVPKDKWVGKTLKELNLRQKYGVNVIAIKDGKVEESVDPDKPLKACNPLIMILHKNNLSKLDRSIHS
ncbi:trk system potassium uptake protein TrkA [Butyrivibrio fibrisolvens DSM 3071]|jgi:trk system potassium uptake protein TrkA|uniref:Trk system potassium uptake protein TrkA n=1 Tax=Butyrivibrio fibrisolvens DSM 3071 TaxID=1121131 RepID=A0A1M5TZG2_BUTFI|nr:TrkA family potassium uptake protein [Butyrivibrio fibrisolvens]SHH56011.1 trk system potassium uptake protein TrkA [Butyrivibrio fibrisolvens DSM 3071]